MNCGGAKAWAVKLKHRGEQEEGGKEVGGERKKGTGETTQQVKCFPQKLKDLSSIPGSHAKAKEN